MSEFDGEADCPDDDRRVHVVSTVDDVIAACRLHGALNGVSLAIATMIVASVAAMITHVAAAATALRCDRPASWIGTGVAAGVAVFAYPPLSLWLRRRRLEGFVRRIYGQQRNLRVPTVFAWTEAA